VAGGTFIVQQAGGKLATFSGNGSFVFDKTLIASSTALFPAFFEVVNQHFNKSNILQYSDYQLITK
jgi:3'-phosphoadenosine 5'-phosphosulfate (PAPS) 3'-phosphatase